MIHDEYARLTVPDFLLTHMGGLMLEEAGAIFRALHVACFHLEGQRRRSGGQAIEHAMLVTRHAIECNLSIPAVAASMIHDVFEDSERNPSFDEIEYAFEGYGAQVVVMLKALTESSGLSKEQYYEQIVQATEQHYEVIFVKLFDRLDGQEWSYDREDAPDYLSRARAYYEETLRSFNDLCRQCRRFIPANRLQLYDQLVRSIMALATVHLVELDAIA